MGKFLKFGIIGIINTGITIGSYSFLIYLVGMNYLLANVIGYFLGMINSFIWNKNWVFKVKDSEFSHYVKFLIVNSAMLGLSSLGLFILVRGLDLNELLAQVIVVGGVTVINFTLTKLWTFAPS